MNKFMSSLLVVAFSASSLFISSVSQAATPGIDLLKENTIQSFLQKANDPKTPLHKKLVELNQADGRNINGIFPKTLTAKNIQIVTISGEDEFGSYCYGIQGKTDRKCSKGVYETYLILIPSKMGVHKAYEYDRFQFIVKASKKVEWKIDENEKEYDRHESIKIEEPTQIFIEKLVPDSNGK